MKLRILDDSIRLRLSQGDVDQARQGGAVEACTRFPDGSAFTYAFEVSETGTAGAAYEGKRLVIRLPAGEVSKWATDDSAVSLRRELPLPAGGELKLLVEKDFRCLTGRDDEDQTDLFPNPDSSAC